MAQDPRFAGVTACVFDAYGTLFDVHSAVGRYRDRLGDKADPLSALWRLRQLEYTWLRSLMRAHVDFEQVTADALDFAMASHDVDDKNLRADLLAAYMTLDCYPEVPKVLDTLREGGKKTAILSNGSPRMLEAAVAGSGLNGRFDAVLSVEDVGIFKPDPSVYRLAVDRLGLAGPEQVSFQSSNAWDAAAAGHFGFKVAWCNRFGQPRERLPGNITEEIKTLDALPALVI